MFVGHANVIATCEVLLYRCVTVHWCSLFSLLCCYMAAVFAMGVPDSGKTQLIRIIHPSIFIHVSVHLSAPLLLRGEQETCCCSLQLRASHGLFWKQSDRVAAGLWGQVRGRATQFILTLTLRPGLHREPDRHAGRLINIPQVQST